MRRDHPLRLLLLLSVPRRPCGIVLRLTVLLLLLCIRVHCGVDLLLVRRGGLRGGERRGDHRWRLTVVLLRGGSVLSRHGGRRRRSRLLRQRAVRGLLGGVAGLRWRRAGGDGHVRHLVMKVVRGPVLLLDGRRRRSGVAGWVGLRLRRVTRLRDRQGGGERRCMTRRLRRIRWCVLSNGRRRSRNVRLERRPHPLARLGVPNRLRLVLRRLRRLLRLRLRLLSMRILRSRRSASRLLLQRRHLPVVLLHLSLVLGPLPLVLSSLLLFFRTERCGGSGRRALQSGKRSGSGVRVGRLARWRWLSCGRIRLLRRTRLRVAIRLNVLRRVGFCWAHIFVILRRESGNTEGAYEAGAAA